MNISKAIQPISQHLRDTSNDNVDIITPYKGSPPGIRPIFVYGNSPEDLSEKILAILDQYKSYNLLDGEQKITILERDNLLFRSLIVRRNNIAETDTILKLKGMEKSIIVWSTRIDISDRLEINHFIYTIMTRTNCMLIVALYDNIKEEYLELMRQLSKELVIIWDRETEEYTDRYNLFN